MTFNLTFYTKHGQKKSHDNCREFMSVDVSPLKLKIYEAYAS